MVLFTIFVCIRLEFSRVDHIWKVTSYGSFSNRVRIIYELVKFMLVVKGTEVATGCLRNV